MLRFYIVRHGQTEFNVQKRLQGRMDSPLTEKGRGKAAALGRYLFDVDFDLVITSPGKRAQTTAELICRGRDVSIQIESDMREINLSHWEGRKKEDIVREFPKESDLFWNKPHLYKPKEGDSYYDVQKRAVNLINRLAAQYEDGNILIVTHTVVIKAIAVYFMGYTMDKLCELPLIIDTSITTLEANSNEIKLVSLGETPHFNDLLIHPENV